MNVEKEHLEVEQEIAPEAAPLDESAEGYIAPPVSTSKAREESAPVIVIRRTTFNYVFIAVVFLLVGIFIGAYSAFRVERANRSWLTDALSEAMSENVDTFAQAMNASRAPSLTDSNSRFEVTASSDYFRGGADATVEIIEFGDFNCGFCGRFHKETYGQIAENYGDQVRFVYRDFPILAETSVTAAVAARCAGEQGRFWEYHDLLFENQGVFNQNGAFAGFAEQLELNLDDFNTCVEEQRHIDDIAADYQFAQSLGIRGTPAFFINGRPISGAQPYEVFAALIDEELAANVDTVDEAAS